MRPASCARHVLRRSALACSVLAVRRAALYAVSAGAALAPWHPVRAQCSSSLPPVESRCNRPLVAAPCLCRQSKADAASKGVARIQSSARPVPPAAVALVPTGWRVASSVCRCFCACAASVGGCWFSRLVRCLASRCYWLRRGAAGPARVAFPAPVAGAASVLVVCAAWSVWCAPRAQLVARGPPRAAALLRPWWLAAAWLVCAASGLLDAAALAAVKGARLLDARP